MTAKETGVPAASQAQNRRKLGARTALCAGFGALLILMVIVCVDSLRTLAAFEGNNNQIRQAFLYRERTLEQVRASLYESGNVMRDYITVESDPSAQETLGAEFQSIRNETDAALRARIQSLPAKEREPFQQLAVELESYWSTVDPIFALTAKEMKEQGGSLLRTDILSQHAHILAITKEISGVNNDEMEEAEQRTAEVFVQFRRRLLAVVTAAFSLGLVLAAATILYSGRLERSVEEKYEESLRARRELKELSKRLVDAEEQERRAISRELHDEVGQSLSALLMDVEGLALMPDDQGVFRHGLQNIKMLAENCVNEVRNMALLLRPSMLDDLGLVAALEWQAREVSKRTGMLVETVDENVSDDLPEGHRICMYRVVQEALNNCSKHADAKNVRVLVRQEPGYLRVRIEDDGKGFDSTRVRGLGLVGMNERVSQLGGVLKVDSDPARGTRLQVDLPLPRTPGNLEK
jgi:signal transduction histidine kinase